MAALPAQAAALFAATALAVAAPAPSEPAPEPAPVAAEAVAPATEEPATTPVVAGPPTLSDTSAQPAPTAAEADAPPPNAPPEPPAHETSAPAGEPAPRAVEDAAAAPAVAQPAPRPSPAATAPAAQRSATASTDGTPPATVLGCAVDLILGVEPILGTDGDDVLTGTPGNDFICGLGGNDTIDGGDGDDTIDGGDGDDRIEGGEGDDTLGGGAGDDQVAAEDGDDTVAGGEGNDCLGGGSGNDRLLGGPGSDVLFAQTGSDVLLGGSGSDNGFPQLDDERRGEEAASLATHHPWECAFVVQRSPSESVGRTRRRLRGDARGGRFRSGREFSNATARDGGTTDDGVFESIIDKAKQVVDRVAGLAVSESAAAASRTDLAPAGSRRETPAAPAPLAFALAPLERPLPVDDDGVARVWITCGTSFLTSEGSVTLRTLPRSATREPRRLGSPTRFECRPARPRPVVEIELPEKDRLLVKRLGRLRVRATAEATNDAGVTTQAQSRFTLVPDRR